MVLKTQFSVAAVICILAGGFVITPVEPVAAQGLFQQLFGGQRYDNHDRKRLRRYHARENKRRAKSHRKQRSVKSIRVKSAQYYVYKPDALKTISFASLSERVASAEQAEMPLQTTPFGEARIHLASFRMRTLAEVASAIKAHYSDNPKFIWVTGGRVNAKARTALATLEKAGDFGLSADDYRVAMPEPGLEAVSMQQRLIEFEMELSAKVLTYVLDATRGRIDPNRISGYHDFARKRVDLAQTQRIIAATNDVGDYLVTRNPNNPPFRALVAELADSRTWGNTGHIEIADGTFLKPGATSRQLVNIMAAIGLRGTASLKADHAETLQYYDGGETYSPKLVALVRDFQRENGLRADGIVGKKTLRALKTMSVEEKIGKVELALERLRWLPRDLGARHVFINQPAFSASYIHAGGAPLSMRAVVGKKSNQTNFFSDRIETVEYNPYWGVPRSIIVNEMLPKLFRDRSYLDRLGYEVTTASGRRVSSRSVNWYNVGFNKAPINVRQPPGRKNALGELKILFPNKHSIYMHDTPAKNLFSRETRAFSHGCVRLQRPREMAAAVLGKSTDYIAARIAGNRNTADKVTVETSVHVAYFTAWPDPQQGSVRYYDDIYDRDKYLSRAIESTSAARHVGS